MSERSDPRRIVACPICERGMPLGSRSAHLSAEHPGYRLERRGWKLAVIDPDGSERVLASREVGALNARARTPARPESAPASPPPAPADEGPGPTIDQDRRPFAWQAPATPPIVSRQAIADALSEQVLADMLRKLSATLSDWDGAGEAGTLSMIESMQLASLFYDSTLGIIERYFRGNVDRFKLTLGLAILLLGKGRIHLRAIARRRAEATTPSRANAEAEGYAEAAAADEPTEVDTPGEYAEPEGTPDLIASIAARQRAWAQSGEAG